MRYISSLFIFTSNELYNIIYIQRGDSNDLSKQVANILKIQIILVKEDVTMKKTITLFLSIILILNLISFPVHAHSSNVTNTTLDGIEIECTVNELENGIEIKCYYDMNGNVYANPDNTSIEAYSLIDLITFSVKLNRVDSSQGYLRWTITLSPGAGGLTKVTGHMYCKSFSIFKDPYAYQTISSGRLPGNILSTSGTGARFALPTAGTKVKVGWDSVLVYTVDNATSIGNVWSTVVV